MGTGNDLTLTLTSYRRRYVISEASQSGLNISQQRANWEVARRFGRSAVLQLTTDSWRDSAGALYAPNMLAPISLPILKTDDKTWLISDVTYKRDENGTTCDLLIMPPEAFSPEPISAQALVGGSLPAELTYGTQANQ